MHDDCGGALGPGSARMRKSPVRRSLQTGFGEPIVRPQSRGLYLGFQLTSLRGSARPSKLGWTRISQDFWSCSLKETGTRITMPSARHKGKRSGTATPCELFLHFPPSRRSYSLMLC
ncbi:hypothetical protein C8Q77DRAFT_697858 [Trametes polyzona]|nr:hypothetical protein C8Q77DRAFT_697858 [Trametes polyzona]